MRLLHPERLQLPQPVHARLSTLARKLASISVYDLCVVTGVRDAAEVAQKWAMGRTTRGPHAGEPGYPLLGLTVTNVNEMGHAPHALRMTPEGLYGCAVDLQLVHGGKLLEGRIASESAIYQALGQAAEKDGFTWGGRFTKVDLAHYELPGWRAFPLP
jgi:D-alanyl-D-alanine carboxypeptidase